MLSREKDDVYENLTRKQEVEKSPCIVTLVWSQMKEQSRNRRMPVAACDIIPDRPGPKGLEVSGRELGLFKGIRPWRWHGRHPGWPSYCCRFDEVLNSC